MPKKRKTAKKKGGPGGFREGAGRTPFLKDAVVISAVVPEKLRTKLEQAAKRNGVTRSEMVRRALEAWLG